MTVSEGSSQVPPISQDASDRTARHLRDYWRVLVQRRWVVFTCLGAVVATTLVLTFLITPEYEATTTLQIERQGPNILNFKDIVGADPSYASYQDFYQTQYKILQSRTVIHLAIERLDLMNRPEFAGRKQAPIQRFSRWAKSTLFGAKEDDDPLEPALKFIEENLSIQPVRNSQLVRISFTDRSPALARELSNAMAEAFLQFNYESRYGTTALAKEFLTKEVARVQSDIGGLERKLQEYGTQKEILALSDGTKDISEQALGDLNSRYIEARGRLAVVEARYGAVRNGSPESLPEVLNSSLINTLRQQYAEMERKYTQMAERFKPDWPDMQQLQGEMEQSRQRLELEAQNIAGRVARVARADYEKAKAEVANLEKQVATQKIEVQRVNRDAIEYASLKAEIGTKRTVLTDLVSRESETATSERLKDTTASNIRIVDPAETPKKPAKPKKVMNLLLALILGSALGVGAAFLADYLDNTVKSEQDILRIAKLPVLGYVPHFQPLRAVTDEAHAAQAPTPQVDLASHTDSRSGFAEAFKNLRTSLLLASADRPPRSIVVTSCEPQDGKSTVSVNLSIVLTQLGRRVLLVDADLRRPRLHKVFGIQNAVGLSNFLSGNATADELIQETDIPNLRIVVSGPVPPNPSELLGSPALDGFLGRLVEEHAFDHVIFDSPPLVSVTDPVILASRMDGTMIVVRAGKTARESLVHATERIQHSRARVIGAVLNAVTEDAENYYYYGKYRYYRHYGEEQPVSVPNSTRRSLRRRRHGAGHA